MSEFVITTIGFLSELFLFSYGGYCQRGSGGLLQRLLHYFSPFVFYSDISPPPLIYVGNVNEINFTEIVNGLEF